MVSRLLSDPLADVLSQADNITDRTVLILNSHVYNASIIRFTVKRGMYLYPSAAEFFPDIIGKYYIGTASLTCLIN